MKEADADIFIRFEELISIKEKVVARENRMLDSIVSASKPYGLRAETMLSAKKYGLPDFSDTPLENGYKIFGLGEKQKRMWKYIPSDYPLPKKSPCLNKFKVFIAEAYGCGAIGEAPSTPVLSTPGELCTETFLEIGPFDDEVQPNNLIKYIKTRFFRALIGIQKQTQHTTQKVYRFVPMQDFSESSDIDWSKPIDDIDEQLFAKYSLNSEEIEFIEKNIQEMK